MLQKKHSKTLNNTPITHNNSSKNDPRITYFDQLAAQWDAVEPGQKTMTDKLEEQIGFLALSPGLDLLEVGCGTGKTTAWLAHHIAPGRVTAIDFSPRMIDHAITKNIDADFRCLDVCSDDLGHCLYDVIFCFHCFPHFRDQHAALSNFTRAMKNDARLIIIHLAGSKQINSFHANLDSPVNTDHLPSSPNQWNTLLSGTGLKINVLIDNENLFFLQGSK